MATITTTLMMRNGPIPGSSYVLEKPQVVLGRELNNDIPVPDPEISRRHARFITRENTVYVEDLGSTNGTFVNGVRIKAPTQLHNGDIITLAESTVLVVEQSGQEAQIEAPYIPPVTMEQRQEYVPVQTKPEPAFEPVSQPAAPAPLVPPVIGNPPKEPAKKGWCSILLIILAISLVLIILILIFMPPSWWCLLTFNALSGCPVQ